MWLIHGQSVVFFMFVFVQFTAVIVVSAKREHACFVNMRIINVERVYVFP
jgi:hypothetical protein